MKWLNIFFIVLFLVSAVLQYNDPDPIIWVTIYLLAAILCFRALHRKLEKGIYIIVLFVLTAYALYLFFDKDGVLSWIQQHQAESLVTTMKASKPWIEETREFFGLILVITSMLANMAWPRYRKNSSDAIHGK